MVMHLYNAGVYRAITRSSYIEHVLYNILIVSANNSLRHHVEKGQFYDVSSQFIFSRKRKQTRRDFVLT